MKELVASTDGSPRFRKPSRSRGVVLRAIDQMDHPFSVSELVSKLRRLAPKLGRSAIYRTLAWLEQAGRLRRVATALGRNVFVRLESDVVCLVECPACGAVQQIDDQELSLCTGALASRKGFALEQAVWMISTPCLKHRSENPA
jgi:Fe2+ or Zn2+ uptake regulation protein